METKNNDIVESTLDESVYDTIMRDVRVILAKMKIVFFANVANPEIQQHLDDWDLWGPLLIGLLFSLWAFALCIIARLATMRYAIGNLDDSVLFSAVILIQWLGAVGLYVNAKLLNVNVSCFQMICATGYALTPALIRLFLECLLDEKFIIVPLAILSLVWSVHVVNVFLSKSLTNDRRLLVLIPVAIYFFCFNFCFYPINGSLRGNYV